MGPQETIRYTWADINLKVGDCFRGVIDDMRELFSMAAKLKHENEVLMAENKSLRIEIEKINVLKKERKNDGKNRRG
jgi:cell shape-determining protein MreC